MNKSITIILLLLVFGLQIFVPAQMIYQQENTRDSGTAYKFKTRPIDPTDPFRGKFVVLNYEMNSFETQDTSWNDYKGTLYVYLKTNAEGFADIKTVSKTKLDTPDDYVLAKYENHYNGKVHFSLPFNRFYMNEYKAYDAEVAVRSAQIDTSKTCYGLVFVEEGTAVLDNVYIDDRPLIEFVNAYRKTKKKADE